MRPAAEIDELPLPIKAQRLVIGEPRLNVLDLQLLIQVAAKLDRLFASGVEPLERLGFGDDFFHLLFDAREVVFADLRVEIEVVIKPVSGGRAECEADSRIEPHDRSRHDVGG